ncbi:Calcium-binding protein CML42 [Apostasia shenzhenica]|uniref:Calcium-binding protein CML42 n=1 Tax=Apostasia shenzhenica TaxID=1088818 RepID=A0A2I0AXL3_9ASPA|nr:Calcium-binding protein CML42 [Apostasia shenzhenica]
MAGVVPSSTPSAAAPARLASLKSAAARPSPSFRLRSSSLNSLRLRRVFDLFDHNGDGEITADEFCLAMDRLGLGADPAELCSLVASFIQPGRLGLDFEDFCSLHLSLGDALFGPADGGARDEAAEEEDMREAFRVFDEDRDGYISAKELQTVLGKLGLAEGRCLNRVQEMIGSVDQDSDGRVDFFEFKGMMKTIASPTS